MNERKSKQWINQSRMFLIHFTFNYKHLHFLKLTVIEASAEYIILWILMCGEGLNNGAGHSIFFLITKHLNINKLLYSVYAPKYAKGMYI